MGCIWAESLYCHLDLSQASLRGAVRAWTGFLFQALHRYRSSLREALSWRWGSTFSAASGMSLSPHLASNRSISPQGTSRSRHPWASQKLTGIS